MWRNILFDLFACINFINCDNGDNRKNDCKNKRYDDGINNSQKGSNKLN